MIVDTPGWFVAGQVRLWLSALLMALLLHLSLLVLALSDDAPVLPEQAAPAVMLSFAPSSRSIQIQHTLPIGPPQVITVEQRVVPPEPQADVKPLSDVQVEASPLAPEPRLIVAREKAHSRKPAKKKINNPRKQDMKDPADRAPAEQASRASAQSVAAPASGTSSDIAAPYDSHSRNTGSEQQWQARVLGHLARNQGYPAQALAAHLEGRVLTSVVIDRQGNVLSVRLRRSSGHTVLDQYALRAIERRSPVPRPPEEIIRDLSRLQLNIPVDFNVRKYRARESASR